MIIYLLNCLQLIMLMVTLELIIIYTFANQLFDDFFTSLSFYANKIPDNFKIN